MDGSAPKDDLKWFGEGFDGFPKKLPEDTVEYAIHIVDSSLSDSQTRARLSGILQASADLSKKLLKEYIWQRDEFKLELKRENTSWALFGRTNHGDSIDDEWLIVFMLRELSKKFEDAWIRVYDTDGEFLLIEAANVLPKWLNPEIAENRVWLHRGNLNIIPLHGSESTKLSATDKKPLSINEALAFIKSQTKGLIHSPLIENEALYRLRNHPQAISSTFHRGAIRLPRKLAYLLRQKPSLISPAIEAFYLRDPISMRALHGSEHPSLTFPPEDLVTATVKFTKVGFAQMRSQRYVPPKVWASALPRLPGEQQANAAEMGMKLACGFDMLLSDPQQKTSKAVREIQVLLDDLESGNDALPTDAEIRSWSTAPPDSEAWLDIDYASFEKELEGAGGGAARSEGSKNTAAGASKAGAGTEGFGDRAAQENLRKMVERFEAFLNDDDAGAEGAEYLDDMDMDDDNDDEEDGDEDDESSDSEEDKDVSFDEAEFARMMKEMMGFPSDAVKTATASSTLQPVRELDEEESEDEGAAIEKDMRAIEEELKEHGALNLNPPQQSTEVPKLKGKEKAVQGESEGAAESPEEDSDAEVDINFNLVKNMLESLKGQAGLAGPAGNMMGLMGINMPPDEDEGGQSSSKK